jgi:hypothetical protein
MVSSDSEGPNYDLSFKFPNGFHAILKFVLYCISYSIVYILHIL